MDLNKELASPTGICTAGARAEEMPFPRAYGGTTNSLHPGIVTWIHRSQGCWMKGPDCGLGSRPPSGSSRMQASQHLGLCAKPNAGPASALRRHHSQAAV